MAAILGAERQGRKMTISQQTMRHLPGFHRYATLDEARDISR